MSANPRQYFLPGSFIICCGTVPVDISNRKVLLVRDGKNGKIVLPKGRKDVGETLEAAATRKTYEETGYRCKLIPLCMESLATGSSKDCPATEPFAMSQRSLRAHRKQREENEKSVLKVIYWFIARVDSSDIQIQGTQMPSANFTSLWINFDQATEGLSFDDDKQIVAKALELVQRNLSLTGEIESKDGEGTRQPAFQIEAK